MSNFSSIKRIRYVLEKSVWVFVLSIVFAIPAMADEMWYSPSIGNIIWEKDFGSTAVFAYEFEEGTTRLFINGLAAHVTSERGSYDGYWVNDNGEKMCEAELVDPTGTRSRNWGRFKITFEEYRGLWKWTGYLGNCFYEPEDRLDATPVTD